MSWENIPVSPSELLGVILRAWGGAAGCPDDPKLMERFTDYLRKCFHMWLKTGSCLCCVVDLRVSCFGLPDCHALYGPERV